MFDVPKPLQAVVGKTSIKRTLGTKEPVKAKRLFPATVRAVQGEIDAAGSALKAAPRCDAESIVNRWFVEQGRRLGGLDFAIDTEGMLLTIRDVEAARAAAWRIGNPISAHDIDDWFVNG